MGQSRQLGSLEIADNQQEMRRLNRIPIVIAVAITLIFLGVVIVGLSWRRLALNHSNDLEGTSNIPATTFGEQLKKGISDGIIGEPEKRELFQPTPPAVRAEEERNLGIEQQPLSRQERRQGPESEDEWKARLKREGDEQFIREAQRQRMARLQARVTALDSPLGVDVSDLKVSVEEKPTNSRDVESRGLINAPDLYESAMRYGLGRTNGDENGQTGKEDFLNREIKDLGYLPSRVVAPMTPNEIKRGSVIPAMLVTGLNSDLPGRITAQVSQNVYDSATGDRLLIPQGAKLFGRYDSKVSFGQERVLVVWTDLIFPNGSTLQISAMAGTDAQGYGGFKDKIDRHLLRTFGSAALIALIGTGIDASVPEKTSLATQTNASDAARRNFADSFGRVAEQTISKTLNVQPTIDIRPGYIFNVLVDQDISFPSVYKG